MAQLEQRLWQSFRSSFRGPILRAGDAEYDGARKIWNGLRDQLPLAILRCTGVADVTAAIGFARDHGLAAAVRGGGHSIAGHGVCSGGVVIDLSLMHQVHVSPEHRSARAAGGATWGDFDHETQLFSFGAPGGLISSTGVAGLTMGGGMGWLSRKYGMSCDQLEAVEMVTAQG